MVIIHLSVVLLDPPVLVIALDGVVGEGDGDQGAEGIQIGVPGHRKQFHLFIRL